MEKRTILFVGGLGRTLEHLRAFCDVYHYDLAVIYHRKPGRLKERFRKRLGLCDYALPLADTSEEQIQKTLTPHINDIAAAVSATEKHIPFLQKVIPFLPDIPLPSVESLTWSTNKTEMRKKIAEFDDTLGPLYEVVENASDTTIRHLSQRMSFPLIVKPSGLSASMLVNKCANQEELQKVLNLLFEKIHSIYTKKKGRGKPSVIVEEFIEGRLYSTDVYVGTKENIIFCPFVQVTTGREVGQEDFFGYMQLVPSDLNTQDETEAKIISKKAIHALQLEHTIAHVELMRTDSGWKVIEVGPRMGGFRAILYKQSYNIDHKINEVLIRLGKEPFVPRKQQRYVVALKLYPNKEGILTRIRGIRKIRALSSYHSASKNKKNGKDVLFARHGGSSVVDVILANESKEMLLNDVKEVEKIVEIQVR